VRGDGDVGGGRSVGGLRLEVGGVGKGAGGWRFEVGGSAERKLEVGGWRPEERLRFRLMGI